MESNGNRFGFGIKREDGRKITFDYRDEPQESDGENIIIRCYIEPIPNSRNPIDLGREFIQWDSSELKIPKEAFDAFMAWLGIRFLGDYLEDLDLPDWIRNDRKSLE